MKINLYDKTASMLIALLILGGGGVAVLLGLWLSGQVFGRPTAVPVSLVPVGDGAGTSEDDPFDPNVLEPGMEFETDEPSILESLESVIDVISDRADLYSDVAPGDDLLTPGARRGDGRTKGSGTGLAGQARRWEVRFEQGTTDQYAAMLDFFGIELGVLMPGGKVRCVSRLSSDRPVVREIDSSDEKRYYLTRLKGDTENADRELLAKANVPSEGRLILKLLPPELERELAEMERRRAGDRVVKGSFYRVVPDGTKYRFDLYYQVY